MPLARESRIIAWYDKALHRVYAPHPQGIIHAMTYGFGDSLALEAGYCNEWFPESEDTPGFYFPSDDDRALALRQRLPVAVVIAQLCRSSGIEIPDDVRRAMEHCDDLPWLVEDRPPGEKPQ